MFIRSWLMKMQRELEGRVGAQKAEEALEGWEAIDDDTPPEATGEWFSGFSKRLDALNAPAAVATALQCCSCAFDDESVKKIKEIYAACGSVREFAEEIMRQKAFGKSLVVKGGILYITKRPICESGYSNRYETRYSRLCHCPLACTATAPVPKLYCNCGGGYYKRLFDELWNADVKVEPISTYIAGDAACVFAVHIPEHVTATIAPKAGK